LSEGGKFCRPRKDPWQNKTGITKEALRRQKEEGHRGRKGRAISAPWKSILSVKNCFVKRKKWPENQEEEPGPRRALLILERGTGSSNCGGSPRR